MNASVTEQLLAKEKDIKDELEITSRNQKLMLLKLNESLISTDHNLKMSLRDLKSQIDSNHQKQHNEAEQI